jgi:hypothetical protein
MRSPGGGAATAWSVGEGGGQRVGEVWRQVGVAEQVAMAMVPANPQGRGTRAVPQHCYDQPNISPVGMASGPGDGLVGCSGHARLRRWWEDDPLEGKGASDDRVRPGNGGEDVVEVSLRQFLLDGSELARRECAAPEPELIGKSRITRQQFAGRRKREQPRSLIPPGSGDMLLDLGDGQGERHG